MKLVGPTIMTNRANISARYTLMLLSLRIPLSRPRDALVIYMIDQISIIMMLSAIDCSTPRRWPIPAETIGTPSPSDVPRPPTRLHMTSISMTFPMITSECLQSAPLTDYLTLSDLFFLLKKEYAMTMVGKA